MKADEKPLWVYGFISYEDFVGVPYTRRYCCRLFITESSNGYIAFAQDLNTPLEYTQIT